MNFNKIIKPVFTCIIFCACFWVMGKARKIMISEIVKDGNIFLGEVMKQKIVYSVIECQMFCNLNNKICKSFNVITITNRRHRCELFNQTASNSNEGFQQHEAGKYYTVASDSNRFESPTEETNSIKNTNCLDLKNNGHNEDGVYTVDVKGENVEVLCDMTTDGGGWTVFQNRFDGSVNFNRNWEEYKHGFGNLNEEFWLGNEMVHKMTYNHSGLVMYLEGTTFEDQVNHAKYNNFKIYSESEMFQLPQNLSYIEGVQPYENELVMLRGQKFSTHDRDNDIPSNENCAAKYGGGWWFGQCYEVYFNGIYVVGQSNELSGLKWVQLFGDHSKNLKTTRIMFR